MTHSYLCGIEGATIGSMLDSGLTGRVLSTLMYAPQRLQQVSVPTGCPTKKGDCSVDHIFQTFVEQYGDFVHKIKLL